MNNSKWQIHRVGLINFWYYDEEEFDFCDGRMLLRGSNGSGKSVTMQSFIPLLLDGNMRPERLDPFGSRARKMENYLLEEEDEREERTGYLYMELKRMEAEQYVTIGIGMRGRRNKKLDSWYFCITDGRRVGIDIWLYKDVQSKIPYTRIELRNRIGEGGRVMDTQGEYMECVNRLLFGFETMGEYKEMLELLIQLRTPKLSKDFKPSIINDILSNSLQTLSEEELRPMSEAIENMDNIKTNLDALKDSVKAAGEIQKIYRQYNEKMLYDKARGLQMVQKEHGECAQKEKELQKELLTKQEELAKEEEHFRNLEIEQETLKKEEDSLRDSDIYKLKQKEQSLEGKIQDVDGQLKLKKEQEEKKEECRKDEEQKQKKQEESNELLWDEIEDDLGEMEALAEELPFDESSFFIKELKESKGNEVSFDTHRNEVKNYQGRLEAGINILRKEKQISEKYNETLAQLDAYKEKRDYAEREQRQYENQLHETKEELLEQMYRWEKENTVLHVPEVVMQEVAQKIEGYRFGEDYSEIKELVRLQRNRIDDGIREEKGAILAKLQPKKEEQEQLENRRQELENQTEPEPQRSPEVQANRQKLQELQIPYYEFYKTVDFSDKLSEEQKGRLEEALLRMGILDAVIISEEYREQVRRLDAGMCDKYIFGDVQYIRNNLTDCLDVDNKEGDILFYQQIADVLSSISVYKGQEELSPVWIDEQGNYKLGVLEGTITRDYQPRFIGTAARERYKQKLLAELQEAAEEVAAEIRDMEQQLDKIEQKFENLEREWNEIPAEEDLKLAAKELDNKERALTAIKEQIGEIEVKLEAERKELDEVRLKVQEICAKAYLPIRLDAFEEAFDRMKEYEQQLQKVQNNYLRFCSGFILLAGYIENQERFEEDLENIRYELSRLRMEKKRAKEELDSVKQQLELTDYQAVEERFNQCLRRLQELPAEREQTVRMQEKLTNAMERLEEEQQKNISQLSDKEKLLEEMQEVFVREYELGYVNLDIAEDEPVMAVAEKVVRMLESQITGKVLEDLHSALQNAFHENKGYLIDYNLTMQDLFRELRENSGLVKQKITRLDIKAKYRGMAVSFPGLLDKLEEDVAEQERILSDKDRELFEDILANTISKKIRARIHASRRWVDEMNQLMESMQTSSGLRLSLKWKSKKAEKEEQIDTNVLVELLQKDVEIMREDEIEKMSAHFRSKIWEARKAMEDTGNVQSFHGIMREILDYRKWFEFQLECQKTGEKKKELTDRVFFTFSGGEKAMAMYVPLFSAVVAKYKGARDDAPRLISLDEAFAGVDETNIKDMFRLMVEFEFNFMINSQILWGDYETVPSLAIYQLIRPENARYVSVISYIWNGKVREMVSDEMRRQHR